MKRALERNRTMMAGRRIFSLMLGLAVIIAASPSARAEALSVALEGPARPGGLMTGRVPAGSTARFDAGAVAVGPSGALLLGIAPDAGQSATLVVVAPDGTETRTPLRIAPRDYDVQRIDGLPPRKVSPSAADMARIREEGALIKAAKARFSPAEFFDKAFIWPAEGPVTGVYGSRRILNGQPRRPHWGIDIAAPAGTPVRAPAAGTVAVAHKDMFFTGGTVILDHGHGLTTVYSHLQDVLVVEGAIAARGTLIGTVGATGRATGAHLDWRMNLFDTPLDPALVTPGRPDDPPPS